MPIPTDESASESQIRDVNDRPILRAAIEAKAFVYQAGSSTISHFTRMSSKAFRKIITDATVATISPPKQYLFHLFIQHQLYPALYDIGHLPGALISGEISRSLLIYHFPDVPVNRNFS